MGKRMMGVRPILKALLTRQDDGYVPLSLLIQTYHPFDVCIKVTFYLEGTDNNEECCSKDREELDSNYHLRQSLITRLQEQDKVALVTSVTTLQGLVVCCDDVNDDVHGTKHNDHHTSNEEGDSTKMFDDVLQTEENVTRKDGSVIKTKSSKRRNRRKKLAAARKGGDVIQTEESGACEEAPSTKGKSSKRRTHRKKKAEAQTLEGVMLPADTAENKEVSCTKSDSRKRRTRSKKKSCSSDA